MLVANAALPGTGRLDSFSHDEIDRALDINLRAPIQLARALVPFMVERGSRTCRPDLLACGQDPHARAAPSTARRSSGCGDSATRLNIELRGTGVGVTSVFPGFVREAGMFADSG